MTSIAKPAEIKTFFFIRQQRKLRKVSFNKFIKKKRKKFAKMFKPKPTNCRNTKKKMFACLPIRTFPTAGRTQFTQNLSQQREFNKLCKGVSRYNVLYIKGKRLNAFSILRSFLMSYVRNSCQSSINFVLFCKYLIAKAWLLFSNNIPCSKQSLFAQL